MKVNALKHYIVHSHRQLYIHVYAQKFAYSRKLCLHVLRWYWTRVNINVDKKNHYNQNTLIGLEFSNFTIFDQKNVIKIFGNEKIIKSPAVLELTTYRSVVDALTN